MRLMCDYRYLIPQNVYMITRSSINVPSNEQINSAVEFISDFQSLEKTAYQQITKLKSILGQKFNDTEFVYYLFSELVPEFNMTTAYFIVTSSESNTCHLRCANASELFPLTVGTLYDGTTVRGQNYLIEQAFQSNYTGNSGLKRDFGSFSTVIGYNDFTIMKANAPLIRLNFNTETMEKLEPIRNETFTQQDIKMINYLLLAVYNKIAAMLIYTGDEYELVAV